MISLSFDLGRWYLAVGGGASTSFADGTLCRRSASGIRGRYPKSQRVGQWHPAAVAKNFAAQGPLQQSALNHQTVLSLQQATGSASEAAM